MTTQLPILHTDESHFSYTCNACSRCCYDKRIVINPYELTRLARNRGLSTTQFIADFTEGGGTSLRVQSNGACIFLGAEGCTVHSDRPLVCRLYPLGRIAQADGRVSYVECEPHPETAGVYGRDGTIKDYLEAQGVAPYLAASDKYYALLTKLTEVVGGLDSDTTISDDDIGVLEAEGARFVDVDAFVSDACRRTGESFPDGLDALIERHLQLLGDWASEISNRS